MVSLKGFKQALRIKKQEMQIRSMAVGMNSTVDITRDLHVLFLDYDIDDIKLVEQSVRELQEFWHLSDAEIFRTKHGFHVFLWHDVMPYGRVKMIIEYARYVDPLYKYISRYHDHKTVRVAGKYKERDILFVELLKGERRPSAEEQDLGDMKREEHKIMLKTYGGMFKEA